MKPLVIATVSVAVIFLVKIHRGSATGNAFPNNGGDPNAFSLTNILNCAVDAGGRFSVSLASPNLQGSQANRSDFAYWLPQPSGFNFPDNLQWVSRNFDVLTQLVGELQGINPTLQQLSASNTSEVFTPSICADVRFQLNASGMDLEDDPIFITNTLIRQRIIDSRIPGHTFSFNATGSDSQEQAALINTFSALRCSVVHRSVDLGVTYLPQYYVGGRCFERGCGFPIRNGQFCRPDLREKNFRRLPAIRWDCCWEFVGGFPGHKFNCGWRRVTIPILCDCDCSCARVN